MKKLTKFSSVAVYASTVRGEAPVAAQFLM
jgi:hypothetical protein